MNYAYPTNPCCKSLRTKYLLIFQSYKSNLWESKVISKTQNFSLFPNMGSEILCRFLFESNEGIFERSKKTVWTERVSRSFWTQYLFIFGLLENISEEWKTKGYDQNLMLFPNMDSEIVCLFFEKSEGIFERHQNRFGRQRNRVFANSNKSLCEHPKNCRSRWFCRANISLQNVML